MKLKKEVAVLIIAVLITSISVGAYHALFKDYALFETKSDDAKYTLAVTCKRSIYDPLTFYMYVTVTSETGREVGRSALPFKGLDWPDEGKYYYAITNLTLKDQNTKVRIESARWPPLEVPISITQIE